MAYQYEQLANNVATTLSGGINSAVTSLTLASATGFPTKGNFRIIIGSEVLKVTSVSGTSLTVERGSEGTSPASHSNGDAITLILTRAAVLALLADVVGRPLDTPPLAADFAWINQGTATVDDTNPGLYLLGPAASGDQLRVQKQTAPSTPYSVTARFKSTLQFPAATLFSGIGFRESGTGKLTTMSVTTGSGPDAYMSAEHWNSPTSFASTPGILQAPYKAWIHPEYLRLRHDGTTLYHEWSNDGYEFRTLLQESKTAFFTSGPDEIFFYVNPNHATYSAAMRIYSWLKA